MPHQGAHKSLRGHGSDPCDPCDFLAHAATGSDRFGAWPFPSLQGQVRSGMETFAHGAGAGAGEHRALGGALVGGRHGDNPDFRRAAAAIAQDTLFLSLQEDPNSRVFAEDRCVEILRENISPLPLGAAMTDLISNALREENRALKEQIADRDEVVLVGLRQAGVRSNVHTSLTKCHDAKCF